ncbi:DUF2232 domain-containing protein [Miniphocaeibacter halophilus]|uniref:DUF2232 domain-containing protein n=1 Tax=Miniphocaeibacter halophilus TaxID=2931922 RepID=A0AC61MR34_9FIRM|nr:DUF2232 domain-containing protein [Miniphocaeibacter halophilus]QQK08067.1 DUF2232 domain-containing protein [Miniphocaeibacter halophilus]
MLFTEVLNIESKNKNIKNLELINTVFMSYIFYFLSSIIPITFVVLPAPSIILSVKNGMKYGIISFLITMAIIFITGGTIIASVLLLFLLPMIVIMSKMIKDNYSFNKIILVNFFAFIFISVVSYLNLKFALDKDIIVVILNKIDEIIVSLPELVGMIPNLGDTKEVIKLLEDSFNLMKMLLPSIAIIIILTIEYSSLLYSLNGLRKRGVKIKQNFRFINIRVSGVMIIPVILITIILGLCYYFKVPYYSIIIQNVLVIFNFIFIVSGIALVDYYLIGRVNKFVRFIIPLVLISFRLFRGDILYGAIGLIDMFVNFRKRFKRIENEKV